MVFRRSFVTESKIGYEKERRGTWKTIKAWVVSLYKIKEPASEGGYSSDIYV